jgi:peptide deformylase
MKIEYSKNKTKLFQKSEKWDFSNPPMDIVDLAESMVSFMYKEKGIGLAYNQLDLEGNYSVFCMQGDPESFCCINPKIVQPSEEIIELEESCLSFSNLIFSIKRPRHVRVRFTAPDGEIYTKTFANLTARTFFHEMDHLNGIPFWSSVSRLKFDMAIKKAYKKGYDYRDLPYKGL